MENANDFIALEGAATRQCLAILNQPPVPNHHSLALEHEKACTPSFYHSLALEHEKNRMPSFPPPAGVFLHVKAGCIWGPGNVLQGIAL